MMILSGVKDMKALKTSKGAKSGGRPKKSNKLVDVKKYLPWMKRVGKYQIVYNQLDNLEYDICSACDSSEEDYFKDAITQIKKDISNIKI